MVDGPGRSLRWLIGEFGDGVLWACTQAATPRSPLLDRAGVRLAGRLTSRVAGRSSLANPRRQLRCRVPQRDGGLGPNPFRARGAELAGMVTPPIAGCRCVLYSPSIHIMADRRQCGPISRSMTR